MDNEFYLYFSVIPGALTLIFALLRYINFKDYQKFVRLLDRKNILEKVTSGKITSFDRETYNTGRLSYTTYDVPRVSYTVGDNLYSVRIRAAGKPKGESPYSIGDECTVRYDAYDPTVCFVDEFEKDIAHLRHNNEETAKALGYTAAGFLLWALMWRAKGLFG